MNDLLLDSLDTYAESCRRQANGRFADLSAEEIERTADSINAYPGLSRLGEPKELIVLEDRVNSVLTERARVAVLEGRVLWEHTAAGEATRLGLGPKFFLEPRHAAAHGVHSKASKTAGAPLPLTLGARHLLQSVFEVRQLALEYGLDPAAVLARQRVLLIVNEQSAEAVINKVLAHRFMGLSPRNFMFMVQASFHGLAKKRSWDFDPRSPKRLHNHGQMAMQKVMDEQIFRIGPEGGRRYLSGREFFGVLEDCDDLVSYNIEDLGYLTAALDPVTLGLALELGDQGYGMTMEIVANNPDRPIKGGSCAHDPALGRDVVVESFRLEGLAPADISHLNKNFNHYPRPAKVFGRLKDEGLFMPVSVKDGWLYFQPVQGDLNFLVKTAFVTRRAPVPIHSWKSLDDCPAAWLAMLSQDAQPGFAGFVSEFI